MMLSGADAPAHMSEKIARPRIIVPWNIPLSVLINGTLGLGMAIAIMYCFGNIQATLTSSTGYPFIEIFIEAVGNPAKATAMTAFIVLLVILCAASVMATTSRMTWSFARDRGLPGSR